MSPRREKGRFCQSEGEQEEEEEGRDAEREEAGVPGGIQRSNRPTVENEGNV